MHTRSGVDALRQPQRASLVNTAGRDGLLGVDVYPIEVEKFLSSHQDVLRRRDPAR
jgi:hypothetical protein